MDYFLTMHLIHFHSLKLWFLEYAFIESAKEADLTHYKINITFLSRDVPQVDKLIG